MITFHTDGTLPMVMNAIFVFGSNLKGVHGAGAAKVAEEKFGAVRGIGIGLQGQSYAIPTKRTWNESLTLEEINQHVSDFVQFCNTGWPSFYFVTRVGCGLAGYNDSVIAPMFKGLAANDSCVISIPVNWRNLW